LDNASNAARRIASEPRSAKERKFLRVTAFTKRGRAGVFGTRRPRRQSSTHADLSVERIDLEFERRVEGRGEQVGQRTKIVVTQKRALRRPGRRPIVPRRRRGAQSRATEGRRADADVDDHVVQLSVRARYDLGLASGHRIMQSANDVLFEIEGSLVALESRPRLFEVSSLNIRETFLGRRPHR